MTRSQDVRMIRLVPSLAALDNSSMIPIPNNQPNPRLRWSTLDPMGDCPEDKHGVQGVFFHRPPNPPTPEPLTLLRCYVIGD